MDKKKLKKIKAFTLFKELALDNTKAKSAMIKTMKNSFLIIPKMYRQMLILNIYNDLGYPKFRIFLTKSDDLTEVLGDNGEHLSWKTGAIDSVLNVKNVYSNYPSIEFLDEEKVCDFCSKTEVFNEKQSAYKNILNFQMYLRMKKRCEQKLRSYNDTKNIHTKADIVGKYFLKELRRTDSDSIYIFYQKSKKDVYNCTCTQCGHVFDIKEANHKAMHTCPHCKGTYRLLNKNLYKSEKPNSLFKEFVFVWYQTIDSSLIETEYIVYRYYKNFTMENRLFKLNRTILMKDIEGHFKKNLFKYDYNPYIGKSHWMKTTQLKKPSLNIYGYSYTEHFYSEKSYDRSIRTCKSIPVPVKELFELDKDINIAKILTVQGLLSAANARLFSIVLEQQALYTDEAFLESISNLRAYNHLIRDNSMTSKEAKILIHSVKKGKKFSKKHLDMIRFYPAVENDTLYKYVGKIEKFYNYLNKQKEGFSESLTLLEDSLKMEEELRRNYTLFPMNLETHHNMLIIDTAAFNKKGYAETMKKYVSKIHKKGMALDQYTFSDANYTIMPAKFLTEFYLEGKNLHHCLYNAKYYESYANEKDRNIFFVRKNDDKEKPFVTVDINGDRITQVHGKYNKKPEKNVREFIDKWFENIYLPDVV